MLRGRRSFQPNPTLETTSFSSAPHESTSLCFLLLPKVRTMVVLRPVGCWQCRKQRIAYDTSWPRCDGGGVSDPCYGPEDKRLSSYEQISLEKPSSDLTNSSELEGQDVEEISRPNNTEHRHLLVDPLMLLSVRLNGRELKSNICDLIEATRFCTSILSLILR